MPLSGIAAFAAALLPLVLGFALPRFARLPAARARRSAIIGAVAALALAALTTILFLLSGPVSQAFLRFQAPGGIPVSFGVHVDGLSIVMLLTISLIGAAVSTYAARYLDGDPAQARFTQWLSWTLGAVLFLVISSDLVMFLLAWIATSHGLHQLLTFYAERPAARLVARKKFLISRMGDLFLLVAFVLLYKAFGTTEFAPLFARAHELAGAPTAGLIGILLVLGAMTKSAQFPFHTWLPDTMETPTPVSALMHAGIINAGGFLMVRMSPIVSMAPSALWMLAVGGTVTAAFASVVMLTQTDIKRKLAWSTIGQMGFMMLQCGLGAFAAATLHIVGHSFYKGYAFLSSASTVDPHEPQPGAHPSQANPLSPLVVASAIAIGVAVVGAVVAALDISGAHKPGLPVLGAILAMAIAQLLLTERQTGTGSVRRLGAAVRDGAAIAVAYFLLTTLFSRILVGVVPAGGWTPTPGSVGLGLLVLALFFGTFTLQTRLAQIAASGRGRRLYVHAYNGFYLGTLQNRFVQRVWPVQGA